MKKDFTRRQFLKITGITSFGIPVIGVPGLKTKEISLFWSDDDTLACADQVQWAINELKGSLQNSGFIVKRIDQSELSAKSDFCMIIGGAASSLVAQQLAKQSLSVPQQKEALGIIPLDNKRLIACGHDQQGLIYAL